MAGSAQRTAGVTRRVGPSATEVAVEQGPLSTSSRGGFSHKTCQPDLSLQRPSRKSSVLNRQRRTGAQERVWRLRQKDWRSVGARRLAREWKHGYITLGLSTLHGPRHNQCSRRSHNSQVFCGLGRHFLLLMLDSPRLMHTQ